MSLSSVRRERFRRIADRARRIPDRFGLREHTASILVGEWSGDHTGEGDQTQNAVALTVSGGHAARVRWLNDEETALANLGRGACEIGPFTPPYPGGGVDVEGLLASVETGATVHVIVTGPKHPDGAKYRILDVDNSRALRRVIRAVPVNRETA